ncbi:MAG: hypothetical protein E6G64_09670 [Actinobacteria bacterium]|nr:MAG: hypothetical protein E6G64_09670 [Actinomycetota bacterium]
MRRRLARDHAARCRVLSRTRTAEYGCSLRPCIAWCSRPRHPAIRPEEPPVTAAFARRSPPAVVVALATVYVVWGSTYLAIRITDRTQPPLLMSSIRFLIAGSLLYAIAAQGGPRPTWREWRAAAVVGAALLCSGVGGSPLSVRSVSRSDSAVSFCSSDPAGAPTPSPRECWR